MRFVHHTKVRLKDTDATGVLYFAEQFKLALEVFEEFLLLKGFSIRKLMESHVLMPIVHAEADYMAPLMAGDELEIVMTVAKLGNSSVTCDYAFSDRNRQIEVGKVTLVHVTVLREDRQAVPIPDSIRKFFEA